MKLWRGVTAALALMLLASPSFAQPMFGGGIEAGANFSKVGISGTDAEGIEGKMKTGFVAGVFVTVPVTPMIAIMPELVYAQKHAKLSGSDSGFTFEQTLNLDFVELPILVKVTPSNTGGFYIVVGPGFGFRTKAKITDSKFNGQSIPSEDQDVKDDTESVDVSLIAGAGFMKGKFGVEARWDQGLRNLNKDEGEDFKVKSRAATVVVKYFIK